MLKSDKHNQLERNGLIGEANNPILTYLRIQKQKGQSLFEFAMVVPFMLLLVVGLIEIGRAYYYYNSLSKAVREGARYVSGHSYYDSGPEWLKAQNMVVYGNETGTGNPVLPGLTSAMVVLTPRGGTGPYDSSNPPRWVKVSVSYPYTSVIAGIINLNLNLTPGVEMRYVDQNALSIPP